jgi:hypothetical protein
MNQPDQDASVRIKPSCPSIICVVIIIAIKRNVKNARGVGQVHPGVDLFNNMPFEHTVPVGLYPGTRNGPPLLNSQPIAALVSHPCVVGFEDFGFEFWINNKLSLCKNYK